MGQAQRIPGVCSRPLISRERNTIYRYNGSVHRWIVVRQGFSLPIKPQKLRAWFKYWKISKQIFSQPCLSRQQRKTNLSSPRCAATDFSLITQTQICYSTCNITAAVQIGPFQVHFIISRQTFVEDTLTSHANGVTFLCTPNWNLKNSFSKS